MLEMIEVFYLGSSSNTTVEILRSDTISCSSSTRGTGSISNSSHSMNTALVKSVYQGASDDVLSVYI